MSSASIWPDAVCGAAMTGVFSRYADGLERQQLRVAGPDGDGIEGSGLFAHLAPPGTNSKESKQGSYFPGSMR